ncbi:Os09g0364800, partial [Oryza sativa Japonica Group]
SSRRRREQQPSEVQEEEAYKVTVQGFVEPHKVVKRVQATGKKAEIWPYVPYTLVAHPYAAPAYDKRAPPGHVRRVDAVMPVASYGSAAAAAAPEERLTTMFSDENPNACSIM